MLSGGMVRDGVRDGRLVDDRGGQLTVAVEPRARRGVVRERRRVALAQQRADALHRRGRRAGRRQL